MKKPNFFPSFRPSEARGEIFCEANTLHLNSTFPDWGSCREATDEVSLFNKEGGIALQ
jgi:hypothetical protein